MRGITGDFITFVKRVLIVVALLVFIDPPAAKSIINSAISAVNAVFNLHVPTFQ